MSEMTNHSNFSAADIEKYWQGQLTPSQMHVLEKAALEDPFLADAMEGYRERSHGQAMEKDMQELEQRLRARVEEKGSRTIAFGYWWKIAAAVLVLMGGVWIFRFMNTKNQSAELAKNEPFKQVPAPAAANAGTDSVQVTPPATTTTTANANADFKTASSQVEEKTSLYADKEKHQLYYRRDSPSITVAPPAGTARSASVDKNLRGSKASATPGDSAADMAKITSVDDLLKKLPGVEVKNNGEIISKREKIKKDTVEQQVHAYGSPQMKYSPGKDVKITIRGTSPQFNSINGQVVDNRNQPVAGASVTVPGNKVGVATDNNGYFTLKTRDTAVNASIASVGYLQQNVMLRNNVSSFGPNNANQIVLQPASAELDEVVVIGYGTQRKTDRTGSVSVRVLNAEPVVGWDKYNNYLTANKKIPDSSAAVHGFVVVRFTVSRGGKIRNVKIEKSLNKTLDAEAIRLVKNGPAWKVLKGKRAKASVMVGF
ncbi:MAG TPA: TonB family protein [Chitinophagaceae bacterium]|jgi:TonB family protein